MENQNGTQLCATVHSFKDTKQSPSGSLTSQHQVQAQGGGSAAGTLDKQDIQ